MPHVTVVMPVLNEEKFLRRSLDSVVSNDYPPEQLEVLVVDGGSRDGTLEIVSAYAQRHPNLHVVQNPGRTQARAMNLGLAQASGEVIVRMDGHTVYAPDYIRQCVALLEQGKAVAVGGRQQAVGEGYFSRAVALAMNTPFVAGDAAYRIDGAEGWVDTVYLGAWSKAALDAAGGFDERWRINEDYELNVRLRARGGKILLSPRIRCSYFVRSSPTRLARQYFSYGMWKVKTLVVHPMSLRWRQLTPPALVLGLLVSAGLRGVWPVGAWVIPILYLAFLGGGSLWIAARASWSYLPVLPLILLVAHLTWGLGFWVGVVRFALPRIAGLR